MLVITSRLVTSRAVKDAFLGGKIARQPDRALIVQPGFQAFRRFPVVAAPVQVGHHHARFIAVNTVIERSDPREAAVVAGIKFRVDEQMPRFGAVKLIQDRFWSRQFCAFVQTPPPVRRDLRVFALKI